MEFNIDFSEPKTKKVLTILGIVAFVIACIWLFFRQRGIDTDQNQKISALNAVTSNFENGLQKCADSTRFLENEVGALQSWKNNFDSSLTVLQKSVSVIKNKPAVVYHNTYTAPTKSNSSTSSTPIYIHDTLRVPTYLPPVTTTPVVQNAATDNNTETVEPDDEDNGGNPFKGGGGENPFKGGGTNPFKK